MKKVLLVLVLLGMEKALHAQTPRTPYIYKIKADSVLITNSCDTAELIIENHTQTVPGFLFNKGRGRTEFRRLLQGINDTLVMIGPDTLRLPNAWLQGGNRWNSTGVFGTMDNNHIDFYTNSIQRARLLNNGNWQIGYNEIDNGDKLQIGSKGAITFNANLSRSSDRIRFGGAINGEDGQIPIISTSHFGSGYRTILYEMDGTVGLGYSPHSSVGALKIFSDGTVGINSPLFLMGLATNQTNSSNLRMTVSDVNEWTYGDNAIHNPNNYYFLGTYLGAPTNGNIKASLKIGAQQLHFLTGEESQRGEGIEAARITERGHLLIGTTDDRINVYGQTDVKLQVNGSAWVTEKATDTLGVSGTIIQGSLQNALMGNGLWLDRTEGFARIDAGSRGGIIFESQVSGDNFWFRNGTGINQRGTLVTIDPGPEPNFPEDQLALKVMTRDLRQGMVVTMKGRVGVSTVAPTAQFHTKGTVRFEGLSPDSSLTRVLVTDANGNLYYRSASSLTAFNGTLNSDLAVNGAVSAQKMLLSQTGRWPDYVFNKQYQLPSLTEVENFINQNNHLPGVPSAAEVEKKGIDVADNQAVLLKKIEELTLYVIEMEKRSQKQSEEIGELKKMIKKNK